MMIINEMLMFLVMKPVYISSKMPGREALSSVDEAQA